MLNEAALSRDEIMRLIPHQGKSCLLDRLLHWDENSILCAAGNHLTLDNPLRHADRLHPVCGAEYGMQAAALHGAVSGGGARSKGGLLISVRGVQWHTARLDDPAHGEITIEAKREGQGTSGHMYSFRLCAADGACLMEGRGMVALQ